MRVSALENGLGNALAAHRNHYPAHRQGKLERLVTAREGWSNKNLGQQQDTINQRRGPRDTHGTGPERVARRSAAERERGLASHPNRRRRGARAENSGHGEQRRLPSS